MKDKNETKKNAQEKIISEPEKDSKMRKISEAKQDFNSKKVSERKKDSKANDQSRYINPAPIENDLISEKKSNRNQSEEKSTKPGNGKLIGKEKQVETSAIKPKRIRKETEKIREFRLQKTEITKTESNVVEKKMKSAPKKDDVYNIESLVEKKGSKYLVKCENYPEDQNTWEPRSSIPLFVLKVLVQNDHPL